MPNIYIDSKASIKDGALILKDDTAHYIRNVLRYKKDECLKLFNDKGDYYSGTIKEISTNRITLAVEPITPPQSETALNLILCQGLLKGAKMDMVVQKSTELGVKKIVPLISERSQLRNTDKRERWKKIVIEASRQCGRVEIPEITLPEHFNDLISKIVNTKSTGVMLYEQYGKSIKELGVISNDTSIYIIIGPEGGFALHEIELAEKSGLHIVYMGKRVLRSETAALSALTLVQFLYGDMG